MRGCNMTSAIQIDLNGDGYLRHHGILGMKWGVRRYQSKDGSLTSSGKKRYNVDVKGAKKKIQDAEKEVEKRVLAYQYSGYKGKQREKLNKAIENDNLFIQSLFDNKEKCEKMKLSEAVYYIEYLIYFIDKMDEISDKCKKIEDEIDDKNDTSLYNNSYFMMKKSINHFFYSVIITVITTYNVMIDVIDGKSCGECDKEKPMYQLF